MKIIKGSTKRGQELLARARCFKGTDLSDVYGSWSSEKASSFKRCRELCAEVNGRNFHIISANSWQYSVAWEYTSPKTGELMTRIETATNTYIIDGSRANGKEKNYEG